VIAPAGVIRPILLPLSSANQRLPSGPGVMPLGSPIMRVSPPGTGNSVMTPAGVIRPMPGPAVNQRLPSGPAVMPWGPLLAVGTGNSVMTPAGVIRPILLALDSVNQRLPSGPAVMPTGPLSAVGIGNSMMTGLRRCPRERQPRESRNEQRQPAQLPERAEPRSFHPALLEYSGLANREISDGFVRRARRQLGHGQDVKTCTSESPHYADVAALVGEEAHLCSVRLGWRDDQRVLVSQHVSGVPDRGVDIVAAQARIGI
jgi:hypothetical protein